MNMVRILDFLLTAVPAYLMGAIAAFMVGKILVHWSVGLLFAVVAVVFLAWLGSSSKRPLKGEKKP